MQNRPWPIYAVIFEESSFSLLKPMRPLMKFMLLKSLVLSNKIRYVDLSISTLVSGNSSIRQICLITCF